MPMVTPVFILIVSDVSKKWNNLRTQYMKELAALKRKKSGAGVEDIDTVKWKYFRPLNFLMFTFEKGSCRQSNLKVTFIVIVIS